MAFGDVDACSYRCAASIDHGPFALKLVGIVFVHPAGQAVIMMLALLEWLRASSFLRSINGQTFQAVLLLYTCTCTTPDNHHIASTCRLDELGFEKPRNMWQMVRIGNWPSCRRCLADGNHPHAARPTVQRMVGRHLPPSTFVVGVFLSMAQRFGSASRARSMIFPFSRGWSTTPAAAPDGGRPLVVLSSEQVSLVPARAAIGMRTCARARWPATSRSNMYLRRWRGGSAGTWLPLPSGSSA